MANELSKYKIVTVLIPEIGVYAVMSRVNKVFIGLISIKN